MLSYIKGIVWTHSLLYCTIQLFVISKYWYLKVNFLEPEPENVLWDISSLKWTWIPTYLDLTVSFFIPIQLLKSYELPIEVDPAYHPKLIGRRGEVINKIRNDFDVRIQLPDRNDENQGRILIIGYEKSCEAAKEEIMKMVREYVSGYLFHTWVLIVHFH